MTDPAILPDDVRDLQAVFGGPSDAGFGSAVFYEPALADDRLETAARDMYRQFVGRGWTPDREAGWMGAWRRVYTRQPEDPRDVVAALRGLSDAAARSSATMLLDGHDDPARARSALARAFDDASVSRVEVYSLGDGEALSGLLLAARRYECGTTFLVFIMD